MLSVHSQPAACTTSDRIAPAFRNEENVPPDRTDKLPVRGFSIALEVSKS